MSERSIYQLWYGRDEPPLEPIPLHAGPVTALLVGRDLRNVRYGSLEIAQRIYVAIRDRNWDTVPGDVSDLVVEQADDHFAVRFTVTHRWRDIDATWRGEILGAPDGTISYAMDAEAGRDLTYKLIGLNIHHGMRDYVGRPYQGVGPAGPVSGVFDTLVMPQVIADATEVPIFPDVSSLTTQLTDEVAVTFDFEGDTFEFEDQRNWTDGSFKSQSYPPRRNGFFTARQGERVFQKVTISMSGPPPAREPAGSEVEIVLGDPVRQGLPPIGLGIASHGGALNPREAELLTALRPAHLRVDLRLGQDDYPAELERAASAARALGSSLEVAAFTDDDAAAELIALGLDLAHLDVPIARLFLFHESEQATPEPWLALAHSLLDARIPGLAIAGGTNANFCELNRHRPGRPAGDGIVYSINPQIHAFDEQSLVENLAPQAETVKTAKSYGGGAPVFVSPVTFKQRFNAVATSAATDPVPGELPAQVDPRQMSLFAAAWLVGSARYLSESGADAITWFETTGWRGVMETAEGDTEPGLFPSRPGEVFPLYHVLADLAEWTDGEVVAAASSDPLRVDSLAIRAADAMHLLIANLTPEPQSISVNELPWQHRHSAPPQHRHRGPGDGQSRGIPRRVRADAGPRSPAFSRTCPVRSRPHRHANRVTAHGPPLLFDFTRGGKRLDDMLHATISPSPCAQGEGLG